MDSKDFNSYILRDGRMKLEEESLHEIFSPQVQGDLGKQSAD